MAKLSNAACAAATRMCCEVPNLTRMKVLCQLMPQNGRRKCSGELMEVAECTECTGTHMEDVRNGRGIAMKCICGPSLYRVAVTVLAAATVSALFQM